MKNKDKTIKVSREVYSLIKKIARLEKRNIKTIVGRAIAVYPIQEDK